MDMYLIIIVRPSEWPKVKLGTLHSVLLTCHQLRIEALSYFEQQYLPKLALYFDNVPELLHTTQALQALDSRYQDLPLYLHSAEAVAQHLHPHSADDLNIWKHYYAVASDIPRFIFYQFDDANLPKYHNGVRVHQVERSTMVCHRLGQEISVTKNFVPRTGLLITGHSIRQYYGCNYVVLSGRAKDLRWADAVVSEDAKCMRTFARMAKAKVAKARVKFRVPRVRTLWVSM